MLQLGSDPGIVSLVTVLKLKLFWGVDPLESPHKL